MSRSIEVFRRRKSTFQAGEGEAGGLIVYSQPPATASQLLDDALVDARLARLEAEVRIGFEKG